MTDLPATQQGEDALMRIGEMAEKFDVTLRTLRFYEDKGLLTPQRVGTTRLYGKRDQARLKLILMGRGIGFSLDDIQEMLDLYEPQTGNVAQLERALAKADDQLKRLNDQRAEVDRAINMLLDATSLVQSQLDRAKARKSA